MKRFIALLVFFALVGVLNLTAQTQKDGNVGSFEERSIGINIAEPILQSESYSKENEVVSELDSLHTLYERQGKLKEFSKYIKKYYKKNKKDAAKITGIAMWYYRIVRNEVYLTKDGWIKRITLEKLGDSIMAYKYINQAIKVDNKYMPAYIFGGEIQRVNYNIDRAIEWLRNGINAAPESPECYGALAKLYRLTKHNIGKAYSILDEMKSHVAEPLVNLEYARFYYDINELPRSFNKYNNTFWNDSLMRNHFTETDLQNYCTSWHAVYNIDKDLITAQKKNVDKRIYDVACYGLRLYPKNVALVRSAFYTLQRLGLNDSAKVYAEKLFVMPNTKFNTLDYLTYAKLYAAMGDLASADKMYRETYAMCMTRTDETRKESENIESAGFLNFLQSQLDYLRNDEYVIINEHTRLYSQDYEKKISIAQYYIDRKKSVNRTDYVDELNQLGAALAAKAQSVDSTKMVDVWKQVDSVYAEMAEISPNDAPYAILTRLQVAGFIDRLTGEKSGVELSESIIVENKVNAFSLSVKAKQCYIKAHEYLIYYYFDLWRDSNTVKKKRNKTYQAKLEQLSSDLMMIDPNNNLAMQITTFIY